MDTELTFKRLGHLGEIHLVDKGDDHTLCGQLSIGPNFSEVSPVPLAPRPSPQLCPDCKEALDAREAKEEEKAEA